MADEAEQRRLAAVLVADVVGGTVRPATIEVRDGRIESVGPARAAVAPGVLVPGFVDAHVHVESSMLPPWEFARVAMRHGTVASVSTLLTTVGLPNSPSRAGRGGFARTSPRLPSSELRSDVSSPQT